VSEKNHGYVFEVPASATPALAPPIPLTALGRFYHEAAAVDPRTGIVYQTEDRADSLIYRFIPATRGALAKGGRLQVLSVRDRRTLDTRNWAETGAARVNPGEWLAVRWLDIDEVEAPKDDLRFRGASKGAALFARGEGMWFGNGELFFGCTNGGLGQRGQIFKYVPSPAEGTPDEEKAPGRLQLYLEPNNAHVLESVDNVGIAPWGDLILCEDEAAPANVVVRYNGVSNFLRGVTPAGKVYTLGRNRYPGGSELSGACFAPDHPTMLVNIQGAGLTLAITGPWRDRRD
jgi:secreted PhoX family phosphatase